MDRRAFVRGFAATGAAIGAPAGLGALLPPAARAQPAVPVPILIRGARVFEGTGPDLLDGADVLLEGGVVAGVGAGLAAPDGARVIDADGRVLMPGLTDAHTHLMMQDLPVAALMTSTLDYLTLVGARAAEEMLLRGFTTVRDMGGPVFGLKRAIDQGLIPGPRIYPSGATISQTSGHGDFRFPSEIPAETGALTPAERMGFTIIADGVPEMLKRAREILRMGASQIKVMAGGGVSSSFDPLDTRQYSHEEMAAAVDAARGWNTYVAVHAYTPAAVQAALAAGALSIEHGQMIDEATATMIAERGAWLSLQPFLDDEDANPQPEGSINRLKQREMMRGTPVAYGLARSLGLKTAFGTDTLFARASGPRQGAKLAKLRQWYEPWEALRMATHDNHRLFKLSGPRDPYPGEAGAIRPGAHADLILVDGNPLEDLGLVANPDANFPLILKAGRAVKDRL